MYVDTSINAALVLQKSLREQEGLAQVAALNDVIVSDKRAKLNGASQPVKTELHGLILAKKAENEALTEFAFSEVIDPGIISNFPRLRDRILQLVATKDPASALPINLALKLICSPTEQLIAIDQNYQIQKTVNPKNFSGLSDTQESIAFRSFAFAIVTAAAAFLVQTADIGDKHLMNWYRHVSPPSMATRLTENYLITAFDPSNQGHLELEDLFTIKYPYVDNTLILIQQWIQNGN